MVLNKSWLKKTSMECLQNIIDAANLVEILKAFETRIKAGIKKNPINTGGY